MSELDDLRAVTEGVERLAPLLAGLVDTPLSEGQQAAVDMTGRAIRGAKLIAEATGSDWLRGLLGFLMVIPADSIARLIAAIAVVDVVLDRGTIAIDPRLPVEVG